MESDKIVVNVGGVAMTFIIDSGSDCNILSRSLWERAKGEGIVCKSKKENREIYPYATEKPLKVIGVFDAIANYDLNETHTEFVVVDYPVEALLGRETAKTLGLLRIGAVNSCFDTGGYEAVCNRYESLFSGVGLLKDREVDLVIDKSVKPVTQPYRRVPFGLRAKVEQKLQELVDADIIERVHKPTDWISPMVIAPKPNGDIRLCIDMRQANQAIQRQRFPIPTKEEMLLDMDGSKVFSKLDLKWGFHQLKISESSREITTFSTHIGCYRYKRLMFGVNAAPELYQSEIHKVVTGLQGVANMSDDLIVHGSNKEEHDNRLHAVLTRLSERGLTLNKQKCVFGANEVEFLGHRLSSDGVHPGSGKVEAILNASQPRDVSEVRSFLGLVTYLGRFIPNLSAISEPLRRLTCKSVPFVFGTAQTKAFDQLKETIAQHVTLGYFDVNAETKIVADASPVGLGAVLVQVHGDTPRVIAFASRSLTDVERRYSQTEKEGLALVWACERFESYVMGLKFDLVTDHEPLLAIYGKRSKPSARIERWVLRLQPFNFRVVYVKGKNNIADPLSRLIPENKRCNEGITLQKSQLEELSVRMVVKNVTPKALTPRQIERATDLDSELVEVRKCLVHDNWSQFTGNKLYRALANELCFVGTIILRGNRLVIPKSLRQQVLTLAHEGHLGIVGTKQNLRTKVWWPGIDAHVEKFCKSCHECQVTGKGLNPEPLQPTRLPTGPWQALAIDFLGPLPSGESLLVVIDYYSRFYEVAYLKSTTAEKTVQALDDIFFTHGIPQSIKSDNGPQFVSQVFADFCEQNGIDHYRVTPRYPQANGEIERQNASLVKRIKIVYSQSSGFDYKQEIRKYMTAYRSIPHPSTGRSPAELLYGRKLRTKLPQLDSEIVVDQAVVDSDLESKGKSKLYYDIKHKTGVSEVLPGDKMLMRREVKNKIDTPFHNEPVTVIEKLGNQITVECVDGRRVKRNVTWFKPYTLPCVPIAGGEEVEGKETLPKQDFRGRQLMEEAPNRQEDTQLTTQDPGGEDTQLTAQDAQVTNSSSDSISSVPAQSYDRPRREKKLPSRYKDFDMS